VEGSAAPPQAAECSTHSAAFFTLEAQHPSNPPAASIFTQNQTNGGGGGTGGAGSTAFGARGGRGSAYGAGGNGGYGDGGKGGNGGAAGTGSGGGLFNAGTASLTGVTVNFTNNQANGGFGGAAGVPGVGVGGGLDLILGGTVVIDDTTVTGNCASTNDNDMSGTFTT
jgi:hypothetical protein